MKHSKCFWSDLFYVPKYEKVSDKAFLRIMLSSVFGILLCGICLAGLTWAWFTSSISSAANTITAAKFMVNISVIEKVTNTPLTPIEENGGYKYVGLTAGKNYTVTVTADESATATTGYCTVELGSNTYHTIQLYPAGGEGKPQSVEFSVSVSDGSHLAITPQWGTYAKPDDEVLIGNSENDIDALPIQSLSVLEAETEETPKQTETSSYTVSIEPSSQEAELNKTTASGTQSLPDADTSEAVTNEP